MNRKFVFIILIIVAILSPLIALRVGSGGIRWSEFFRALCHPSESGPSQMIIWLHRFPRVIAALLIGAGLATCGSVLQGLLRNPLAEPYTLGISGGAALGATLALVILPNWLAQWSLPVAAFAGALLTIGLVYLIASYQHFSVIGLVLTGVILSFICSSLVLLIFSLASSQQVHSTFFWLIGNLSALKTELIKIIPFFIISGIMVIYLYGRELDIITLGDEKAYHLGVSVVNIRRLLFIITSLIVGACIATAGMIGFVGLVIPHLMRLLLGPKHRPLILGSALAGASFLVMADTIARTVLARSGQELPVGVITGILGGLFFLIFLLRKESRERVF